MSVRLTDEQREFADLAHEVLAKVSSADTLLRERDGVAGRDRWAQLGKVGLLSATVPEAHGGLGLSPRGLVLVAEEVGYFALPEPLIETACIAAPLLARHAPTEVAGEWLPRIAEGRALVTIQASGPSSTAPFGQEADLVIVIEGSGVALCPQGSGTTVSLRESADVLRRLARVKPGPKAIRFGDSRVAAEVTADATAWAAVMLNGISKRLLDMSVDYAKMREQFGRPIGTFQSIKHMLADVATEVETVRAAAWYAVMLDDQDLENRVVASSVAKWSASRAAAVANRNALQVHGGIGFTRENPLSLWLVRGKKFEAQWGTQHFHARILGERLMQAEDVVEAFGPTLAKQAP